MRKRWQSTATWWALVVKRWPCDEPHCGGQYFFEFRPGRGRPALEEITCSFCGYPPGGRAAYEERAEKLRAQLAALEEDNAIICDQCHDPIVGESPTAGEDGRQYCGPCTQRDAFPINEARRRRRRRRGQMEVA